jgi:DNA-binding response OmpR family regulator
LERTQPAADPENRTEYVRPHILIVSDDPDLSGFLSEGLTLGGFWTSVIASGLQVLDVFRLRTFDLAILDAALKGMGTIEVVRRLRSRQAETGGHIVDIPLLIVAGGMDEIDPEEVVDAGADGLLLPPLELEELVPAIFRIVNEWREEHPDRPWADQAAQRRD